MRSVHWNEPDPLYELERGVDLRETHSKGF